MAWQVSASLIFNSTPGELQAVVPFIEGRSVSDRKDCREGSAVSTA
jgi:hypothetical protein